MGGLRATVSAVGVQMTRDEELWGAASMILKQHGERARVHVVTQLGHFAAENDEGGLAIWQEIAWRLEQLIQKDQTEH